MRSLILITLAVFALNTSAAEVRNATQDELVFMRGAVSDVERAIAQSCSGNISCAVWAADLLTVATTFSLKNDLQSNLMYPSELGWRARRLAQSLCNKSLQTNFNYDLIGTTVSAIRTAVRSARDVQFRAGFTDNLFVCSYSWN